jgi:hypothetical protein
MIRRVILAAWLPFLLALLAPVVASACTCSQQAPGACQGLQQGDVVFLGTVTDVETLPAATPPQDASASGANSSAPEDDSSSSATGSANSPSTPVMRYHFRIDERFSGPETPEIDVFSGGDDGDCGYRFQKGQQYVVFTQRESDGRLFSTICDGTRPASDAVALLPQLRAMRNGERVASVFGVLRRSDPPFLAPPDDPDDPLPNIPLKLRSRYDRFSTATGPGGVYTFYDVHAGEYRFTAQLPARMELTQKTLTGGLPPFKIPNGACYEYDVDALPTGHIRGSVLGPDGKPVKLASVELYRAGQYADSRPGLWAFQGFKGFFDFDHIGPGKYVLVYNRMNRKDPNSPFPRAFYPGVSDLSAARPIVLKDGQRLSKVDLRLKKGYPVRRLRVHVKFENGRPPGNLTVMAKSDDGTANPAADKVADDLFDFTLLDSGHYTVSAYEDLDPGHAPATSRKGPSCTVPARIDAGPVTVDASDPSISEVMLVFSAPDCLTK